MFGVVGKCAPAGPPWPPVTRRRIRVPSNLLCTWHFAILGRLEARNFLSCSHWHGRRITKSLVTDWLQLRPKTTTRQASFEHAIPPRNDTKMVPRRGRDLRQSRKQPCHSASVDGAESGCPPTSGQATQFFPLPPKRIFWVLPDMGKGPRVATLDWTAWTGEACTHSPYSRRSIAVAPSQR